MPDVYQIITEHLLAKLSQGTVPWRQPWHEAAPQNLVTKHDYHGINVFLLRSAGFSSPYWVSYRQAQQLGGNVKKGEHATPIIFWKIIEKETEEKKQIIPVLRYYSVFNLLQCNGISAPEQEFQPLARIIHEG